MIFKPSRVALFVAATALTGCGNLFDAGFESDTPGQPPALSPAGLPAGDSIASGPAENFIVTSKMGIIGQQAYAFVEPAPGIDDTQFQTVMRSAPIDDLSKPVYLSWRGIFGSGGGVKMIAGYQGKPFVEFAFDSGMVMLGDDVVGSYLPGDHHTVLVSLFPATGTYRLGVFGDVNFDQEFFEGQAISKDQIDEPQVFAEFSITRSPDENLIYVIDDVKMSYDAPS